MYLLWSDRSGGVSGRMFLRPLLVCLVMAATTHAGIVTLVSQTRFVDVNTTGVIGFENLPPSDQRIDWPDFSPFDQSVNLNFVPPAAFANETVSQTSTITVNPAGNSLAINAYGNLSSSVSVNGFHGTDHFEVTFSLTQAEPFSLTYNGRQGDPRFGTLDRFVPGSFTGPSAPRALTVDPHTGNFFDTLKFSGTLQPGSYTLSTEVNTIGSGSFNATLAVGTAAVPLPPALWEVLAMLPLLMVGLRARRLRHHANRLQRRI